MSHRKILLALAMLWAGTSGLQAQPQSRAASQEGTPVATTVVRGRVEIEGREATAKTRHKTIPETVVWLTPMTVTGSGGEASTATASSPVGNDVPGMSAGPTDNQSGSLKLVQKNKSFEPHLLVVQAGSLVEFPNHDPFFHNVFSLFEGKRFDLGLYEAGTSRMVRFDRPGISYIFCNIHPEMSAVVITVATPLYAIASRDGQLSLTGVPYGRYLLHVWSEGMSAENTQPFAREITIAENAASLGVIRVPAASGQILAHKNKYGREYDDPTPNNSAYGQQH